MSVIQYTILGYSDDELCVIIPFCMLSYIPEGFPLQYKHIALTYRHLEDIPDRYRSYVREIVKDWSQRIFHCPDTIIQVVKELSVGPIRTVEIGTVDYADLKQKIAVCLGHGISIVSTTDLL